MSGKVKLALVAAISFVVGLAANGGDAPRTAGEQSTELNAAEPLVPVADKLEARAEEVMEQANAPSIEDTPMVRQASTLSSMSGGTGDGVATLVVLEGHLCAKVIDSRPVKGSTTRFDVTCTEHRSGAGRVRYRVNGETGDVKAL